jgi:hypothetical protein
MPRQPKRNVNEIFESLKDLNFFNDKGQIVKLSDPIWKEAENTLYSLKNTYIYIFHKIEMESSNDFDEHITSLKTRCLIRPIRFM